MTILKLTISQTLSQLKSLIARDAAVIFTIAFIAVFVPTFSQVAMLASRDIRVLDHLKELAIVFVAALGVVFSLISVFVAILSRKHKRQ